MSPAVLYSRYNIYSGCLPGVFGIIVTICPMLKGKMEAKIPYCRVADKKNSCQTLGPATFIRFIILSIEDCKANYYVGYTTQLVTCIRFRRSNIENSQSKYYFGYTTQLATFIRFRISVIEDSQSNYYVGYATQLTYHLLATKHLWIYLSWNACK
jgi:predicted GIY-YIG superfamily endonuclease